MEAARHKMDAGFEFLEKLGVPFFCFHDVDIAPEGASFAESARNLDVMVELAEKKMSETGLRLLWGTANLFSHPRYSAGASTNPDPEVFAFAAAASLTLWCAAGLLLARMLRTDRHRRLLNTMLALLLITSIIPMWLR